MGRGRLLVDGRSVDSLEQPKGKSMDFSSETSRWVFTSFLFSVQTVSRLCYVPGIEGTVEVHSLETTR